MSIDTYLLLLEGEELRIPMRGYEVFEWVCFKIQYSVTNPHAGL